jgi:hypothetical protein
MLANVFLYAAFGLWAGRELSESPPCAGWPPPAKEASLKQKLWSNNSAIDNDHGIYRKLRMADGLRRIG